jgi:predicted RNA-binding protein with PIN domain
MNVVGSRPDGWWRDRGGAARRLTARLEALAAATADEVAVVFEGGEFPGLAPGRRRGVNVFYATRRGANAADDRIVELVASDPDPGSITVVTSDRDLIGRVASLGATTVGPVPFQARLDAVGG